MTELPQYSGTDYVQNSNNSFWLSNLENPITGVSPLYGPINSEQTLRSRHGQTLIKDSAGTDGLFSATEVEEALLANRSLLAELVLNDLIQVCNANRAVPVNLNGEDIEIGEACDVLANWDGVMNTDSVGAHLFREFAFSFGRDWINPFDPQDPVNTPNGLKDNETTVQELAQAVKNVRDAGLELDEEFGNVQFVEKSNPDGSASGVRLPWPGANNREGGFNVFSVALGNNGTALPRHTYPTLPNSILSAEASGYHINSGSSWMYVVSFTENGPQARGILTYSQSTNSSSDSFNDQSTVYSQTGGFRPLRYTEEDIAANLVETVSISSAPSE